MHEVPDEEEDASQLKFGKDFFTSEGETCLTIDEVCLFMKKNTLNNEIFEQTKNYVERVAVSKEQEDLMNVTKEIRVKLENYPLLTKTGELVSLHAFEVASLASLVSAEGASAEAVIAWISSLIRFDEDHLEKAIEIVVDAKRRVVGI